MLAIIRAFVLALVCAPALAQEDVSAAPSATGPKQIRAALESFITSYRADFLAQSGDEVEVETEIGGLDPRLALPACADALQVSERSQGGSAQLMTQVSCAGPKAWSIYVPVTLTVSRPVVVAARALGRGTVLGEGDISVRRAQVSALHGEYFSDPARVVGQRATRVIRPDAVILANQLEHPPVVHKGDAVMIVARDGAMEVRTSGVALGDGRVGEQIRVRNRRSERVVEATVTAPGETEVRL